MLDDFLISYLSFFFATICLLVSLWISIITLLQHLLNYTTHRLQSYIVRILVFVPIYGVLTFLMFCVPSADNMLEMLRNIWEGLLIHSFLCLMMEYCGGESACGEAISQDPAVLRHPWPICVIKYGNLNEDIPLNVGFVKRCRMGTMQYAFVRPMLALISVVLGFFGLNNSFTFNVVCVIALNVSVYIALYMLALFYLGIKRLPGLAKANCIAKFFSLKMCVVFTFYQTTAIFWFTKLSYATAHRLSIFLILIELPLFAIFQRVAYDISEFIISHEGRKVSTQLQIDSDSKAVEMDLENSSSVIPSINVNLALGSSPLCRLCHILAVNMQDIKEISKTESHSKILRNAKAALDMTDLITDLYYNCSDKYRQHSLLYSSTLSQLNQNVQQDTSLSSCKQEASSRFVENFAEFEIDPPKVPGGNDLQKLQFL